ncbi:MAG TPA: pyridine nucleotide-disulfide oxidoreductase, partial [Legionellales bacterium]|nr:pyridine nucleotide-disulfide oxidoreductase [Legionellales bacterium]
LLNFANQPLQWITENLRKKVTSIESKVIGLKLENRRWILSLPQRTILARNVIVAPGAEPHSLNIPSVEEIPLEKALDPSQLTQLCGIDDKIAVFGSSHSAILVLKTLMEDCNVSQVYNFYRSPLSYAVYLDEWILFDDTGLKGMAAEWARENLDGQLPQNLRRLISSEENLRTILPLCSKAIYATGFSSRSIPVEGMETLTYNDRSGIIAPGLFGLGIAFPEVYQDRIGILSQRVGLWKFMEYLIRVMPIWLKYGS